MGQTLTHGVYLPDEGERNCYNGLAGNWQILDSSVGTIAAHTAALAGKASLVHTHTKSDITDFPAYGTTAGTICEGNDSRLSDARTPVAHTHVTADVTDLLNSAHTWTGANTFQGGGIRIKDTAAVSAGGYGSAIYFYDIQGNRYGYIQPYVTSDNYKNIIIGADGTGRVQLNSDLVPYYYNAVNLGNSTLKWKTLNGVDPGALSLPDYTLAKVDLIDFSQWSVAGQPNEYTPISDGWLFVNIKDTASNSIFIYAHSLYNSSDQTKSTDYSASCFGNGSQGIAGRIAVMLPVRAGIVYRIYIKAASVSEIYSAKFYPALGNV